MVDEVKKQDRSMYKKKPKNLGENEVEDMRKYRGKKPKITEYTKDITENYEELEEDVIAVKEGVGKFTITIKDPYHYAYIEGPGLPVELSGSYTTYEKAKQALDQWLCTRK